MRCSKLARVNRVGIRCVGCGARVLATPSRVASGQRFCDDACYRRWSGPSSLELALYELLDTMGVAYEAEVSPPGRRFRYDVLLDPLPGLPRGLAIEADGSYHHGHPSTWPSPSGPSKRQRKAIARDRRKNRLSARDGVPLLRFWGHELREDLDGVRQEIERVLRNAEVLAAALPEK